MTTNDNEEWRDIPDYEGKYQVSSEGRVRRIYKFAPPLLIKPDENSSGYLRVQLWDDGSYERHFIHRLVLEAFRGGDRPELDGCHLDGNRHNNRLSNLCWGTRSENMGHNKRREMLMARSMMD